MKGGVGKSTVTVNLAWHFAAYQNWLKKVLVIDLDPQFNASQYLVGVRRYQQILDNNTPTMWNIFEQGTRTPSGVIPRVSASEAIINVRNIRGGGRIDLIPSQLELAFSLKNPGQKERHLPRLLNEIEEEYDLILIDCAPTESILTTAAYLCSDYLLVPVKPEYLSSIGLPLLVNSMQDFLSEYEDHDLELAGVVFNATSDYYPEERLSKDSVIQIAEENDWYVFENEVPYSRSFPKGAREGTPIFRTSYSRYSKINEFNRVAREFAERVDL
ncbi:MAG: ParA family protein [Deltaproteobacteria bacterium]|nr:ParA family protein [Deltaproteobacteria bacterium]MBW2097957.1 ParA family protein [Deltaproteobacteria bacterium]